VSDAPSLGGKLLVGEAHGSSDGQPLPRVSVVICTHNGEALLPSVLHHVREQSLAAQHVELLVVDDGSTDRTAEVAAASGVRVISLHPNRGLSAARNAGVESTSAPIIAFTDDDCEPAEGWLEALLSPFVDSTVDGVGGRVISASSDGLVLRYIDARNPLAPLGIGVVASSGFSHRLRAYLAGAFGVRRPLEAGAELYTVVGANMAFRRKLLDELGGFDATFSRAGDEEDLCRRAHDRPAGARLVFEPSAVVAHRFKPELADTLRRARTYGRAHSQAVGKHPAMRSIVYPFPILTFATAAVARFTRRPALAVLSLLIPILGYGRWPAEAWRRRSLEPLVYAYLQLLEETSTMRGELEGLRARRPRSGEP